MDEFVNTIDELGDEVVLGKIIDGTLVEFKDNVITSVGDYGLECTNISKILLPNVTTVGKNAFKNAKVSSINLESLLELGINAFQNTSNLKEVILPNVTSIGSSAFSDSGITKIKAPKLLTLGNTAFYRYVNLSYADVGYITTLNNNTFYRSPAYEASLKVLILRSPTLCTMTNVDAIYNCYPNIFVPTALLEEYKSATNWSSRSSYLFALEEFTNNGTTDGDFIFEDTSNITSLHNECITSMPDIFKHNTTLKSIDLPNLISINTTQCFFGCTNLETVNIPNATTLSYGAFQDCENLRTVNMPNVASIGQRAFDSCDSLEMDTLPSSVTTIDTYAFSSCNSLSSITFQGTPTSIASNAFYRCDNLTVINVPWAEGEVANAPWGATKATINYNYGKSMTRELLDRSITEIVTDSTTIGENVCSRCNALVKVDLLNATNISDQGLGYASNLATVILRSDTLCTLGKWGLSSTPISSGTGYIYVPRALIEDYKVATNWSTYANQFRAIEDYPDVCGGGN